MLTESQLVLLEMQEHVFSLYLHFLALTKEHFIKIIIATKYANEVITRYANHIFNIYLWLYLTTKSSVYVAKLTNFKICPTYESLLTSLNTFAISVKKIRLISQNKTLF